MAINTIATSNTFTDWVLVTNQVVSDLNDLRSNNYTKSSNTFIIGSTGVGLQVNYDSLLQGNVTIGTSTLSTLSVGSNVTTNFANNISVTGNLYSSNHIVVTGNVIATNVVSTNVFTSNVIASNLISTTLNVATYIATNTITGFDATFANNIVGNTIVGNLTTTGVTTGTYGGGSSSSVVVPVITVNKEGRLSSAANATLSLTSFDTISISNVTVSQITTIAQVLEKATTSSAALSGTTITRTNISANTGTVFYFTAEATDNFSFNFQYDGVTALDTIIPYGKAITFVVFATSGASAKYCQQVRVDGNIVTPKWQGGSAPTAGNANSVDAYSFTLFHTDLNTWTVFAAQTRFA